MEKNPERCPGCRQTDVKYLSWGKRWFWYFPGMDEDATPPPVDFCPHCGMELYSADDMEKKE